MPGRFTLLNWAPHSRAMHLVLVGTALMAALQPTPGGSQVLPRPAPFCAEPLPPTIDGAFSDLQAALGDAIGQALECAHPIIAGDMLIQHVSSGALVLNVTSGTATYTDGNQFWTLIDDGTLASTSVAPDGVLRALLMSAVPPDAVISQSEPTRVATPAPTSTPVTTAVRTPAPAATAVPEMIYRVDPRIVALVLSDLPNGGVHAWAPMGEDTTRLLKYQYSQMFGKFPGNGQPSPLDPLLVVNIVMSDSTEQAQALWDVIYSKPGGAQRPGVPLAPIADDQFYALGDNSIDVRARFKNVIFQVIEVGSGRRPISVDDTVGLVRIMVARLQTLPQANSSSSSGAFLEVLTPAVTCGLGNDDQWHDYTQDV